MGGKEILYKDMKASGPLFLYFIRDGDSVCQEETDYISKIAGAYGATRATWYGILNAREDRARSFQAEHNPAFRLVRDEYLKAVHAFGVLSAPTIIQVSSRGSIVHIWHGYSAASLNEINKAFATVNRKPVQALDFSRAPAVTMYGVGYQQSTKNGKFGG